MFISNLAGQSKGCKQNTAYMRPAPIWAWSCLMLLGLKNGDEPLARLVFFAQMAQPLEPGHQEMRVEWGRGPHHFRGSQKTRQQMGGNSQAPTREVKAFLEVYAADIRDANRLFSSFSTSVSSVTAAEQCWSF